MAVVLLDVQDMQGLITTIGRETYPRLQDMPYQIINVDAHFHFVIYII